MNRVKFERERQGIPAKKIAKDIKMFTALYLIRERRMTFTAPQYRYICGILNIVY